MSRATAKDKPVTREPPSKLASAWLYSIALTALVILTAALVIGIRDYKANLLEQIVEREQLRMVSLGVMIKNRTDNIVGLVTNLRKFIPQDRLDALASGTEREPTLQALERLFQHSISANTLLDQLRLIDSRGREVVRVDRVGATIIGVEASKLQDKSDRPYVKRGLSASDGEVLLGPSSLNMENGEIDLPERAVSRLSLTRIDSTGNRWLLVANVLDDVFFEEAKNTVGDVAGAELYIVRSDGILVLGGKRFKDYEFGDQRGIPRSSVNELLPEVTQAILRNSEGSLYLDGGLYVFRPVTQERLDRAQVGPVPMFQAPMLIVFIPEGTLADDPLLGNVWLYLLVAALYLTLLALLIAAIKIGQSHKKLDEQRRRQQKILAMVAHELRTPAAAIDMMLQASHTDLMALDLRDASKHMLAAIDDLRLALAPDQIPPLERAQFSLETLLTQVNRQLQPLFALNAMSLELDCPNSETHLYYGDAYRLRVVISNLLRASAFHSQGSRAWLSVNVKSESESLDTLFITVEDDGVGIPNELITQLNSPVKPSKPTIVGSGLGLRIVQSWIETLGGKLQVSESRHGGAKFMVFVPLVRAPAFVVDGEGVEDEAQQIASLAGKTVLLVEDDAVMRKLIRELLVDRYGAEVVTAHDGLDALTVLESTPIDLMLTDYYMPKLNGAELIRAVKAKGIKVPIIGLTAASIGKEVDELAGAGADLALTKPPDRQKLDISIIDLCS